MKKLNLAKAKNTLHNNKLLFIGLTIGVLLMIPTGIYVYGQNSNRQADEPSTTLETKADNSGSIAKNLDSSAEQTEPTQSNNQSSGGGSSKPTSNYTPTPSTTTSGPPPTTTTPAKPQCSSSLRASAINTLIAGYQYNLNRKNLDLGAWYTLNYQLSTYSYQQYLDKQAENQAWLDNYIAIMIAEKNASLNESAVCTPITRSELGV